MNLTGLLMPMFVGRAKRCVRAAYDAEGEQRRQLRWLLERGRRTAFGAGHGFSSVRSYSDYAGQVAVTPYDELRPYVMRMIAGERDVLWSGVTRRFAQSSGTSDGKSKYIPVTADSLRLCHYRGAGYSLALYLSHYRDSRIFDGKSFILGGSYANELDLGHSRARVGDLSATLIDCINPLVNLVRVPSKKVALMADWHQKLPALVAGAADANVTNISGVPSWFLTVLREVLKAKGAENIHQVWPHLEVFFHGGIAFGPYRREYQSITDAGRMRYWENYNASEGFFAAQLSPDSPGMLLMMDCGVFYEFIPVDSPDAAPVPVWEVSAGGKYALVLTGCNGLWRYPIGDVVRVESVNPLTITIAGRTKSFINAFGEEVMVHNTDAALQAACSALGCSVKDYTVAPVFSSDGRKGRHEWLVEFAAAPADVELFARTLDKCLQTENSDYQAKRTGGIFLDNLSVVVARQGLFDDWLESTGKLGGQRKVPRLSNDRKLIENMLSFNN
ncbi:MAG: GH3 auxin-responsive promoter family protein [Muribaculaceae bacterium]|nr:GH3 auxin-responsive promoter family protein [Muribaculaceae bacterium]